MSSISEPLEELSCPRAHEETDSVGEPHIAHKWHVYSPYREFHCPGYKVDLNAE